MPRVPELVPDVRPIEGTGAREISVNTPGAAFGENIAQAVRSVGGDLEQGGNEIYARAQAIQQLNNETAAKQADAQLSVESEKLHSGYRTLQGRQAVDGADAHVQSLYELRQRIRDSLPNDAARRMYDSNSLSTIGRSIFNTGLYAAQEGKRAANEAASAQIDAAADEVINSPDEESFKRAIRKAEAAIDTQIDLSGSDDIVRSHDKAAVRSKITANWITGIARTNPFEAQSRYNKALEDHILQGQDVNKVNDMVQSQMNSVASRVAAGSVIHGWAPYMKPNEVDRARGIDSTLTRIVQRAQRDNPDLQFTIAPQGGTRTPQEQAALVRAGYSQTYQSNHLEGRAIDLVPIGPDGKPNFNDKAGYAKIEKAMAEAAEAEGIPIGPEHAQIASWDPGHYSLPRDYDVSKAPKPVAESLNDMVDRARAWARAYQPDNPIFADMVEQKLRADHGQALQTKRDDDYRNTSTILDAIQGGYGTGKKPTSVEELLATDPSVAAAWDKLDPQKRQSVLQKLTQVAKGDKAWTLESTKRLSQIKGMAQGDDDERQAFLQLDPWKLDMPLQGMSQVANLQQKVNAGLQRDVNVSHGMQVMIPDLQGLTLSKDDLALFRGELEDRMRDWTDQHKKRPTDDEVRELGRGLLMEQYSFKLPVLGKFGQSFKFQEQPPEKEKQDSIATDPTRADWPPERWAREWARLQFNKMQKKKSSE